MQQAGTQQLLHHDRHAADRMQARHRIRAMRLQVGEQRYPLAHLLDAFDRDRHLGLPRDGEQVQVHVGRAAHRVDRRDRVLEGALGHDVARPDAGGDQPIQGVDRRVRLRSDVRVDIAPGIVIGGVRGAARQHHADRLGDRAHRVGREHRAASAAAGHHVALQFEQFPGRDPAGLLSGPALGVIHDRQVRAFARPGAEIHLPGRAGARIEHQAECIGPGKRHQGGSAGLVATGDHDHRIAVMRVVADLEAIRDDVTRHEAVACGGRSLRQRVGHRRRANDQALPAAFGKDFDQQIADAAYPIVATMRVGPGAGDGDHGIGLRGAVRLEPGCAKLHPRFLPEGAAVLCHEGRLR